MFPYFKVFIDNQSFMNIIWYTDEQKHGFRCNDQIGEGLVSFCELDLTVLEDKLKELADIPLTIPNYDSVRNGIFDAAELLKDKYDYAFFFLVGELLHDFNTIKFYSSEPLERLLCLDDAAEYM